MKLNFKIIYRKEMKPYEEALHHACVEGHINIVKALLVYPQIDIGNEDG